MKLSPKNIEKTIRRIKSGYIRKTVDCSYCNKRMSKSYIGVINGFGGFNYYHSKCLLDKLSK